MPNEPQDVQKLQDRDLLIEHRTELRYIHENLQRIDASMDVRFERMDAKFDKAITDMRQDVDGVRAEVELLKLAAAQQQGGINLGKWMVGALGALPFLGGLVGYFVGERGGP